MKIFDPRHHLPVGWEFGPTRTALFWGHFVSSWTILAFFSRYIDARDALYVLRPIAGGRYLRELDPSRTIASFHGLILGMPMAGMLIFLAVMPMLIWRYYHFHTQGSMSVYTMRRLADPMEYHRRCWTQPVLSAIAELLLFAVLTGLCALVWWYATPAVCRPL